MQASSVARVRLSPTERPCGVERLGLEPGQQPQRLGVALEAAAGLAELGQHPLAVVAERRVAEVVGQRRGLGDVGVAAQRPGQVAGDLGDLEAVGEPVADEVVALRPDHLGLGREPARRRRVHDAGAVALERRALRRVHPLGRLLDEALARRGVVQVQGVHRQATLLRAADGAPAGDRSGRRGDVHVVLCGWRWATRGRP